MTQTSGTISLRRAKSAFRFDHDRDDLVSKPDTAFVFTVRSPLLHGGMDIGVYGCPLATLVGYRCADATPGALMSVVPAQGPGSFIMGRVVEVSLDELARLDQVAELAGDYHRFRTEVTGPRTGMKWEVWVYQKLTDATPVELASSAMETAAHAIA